MSWGFFVTFATCLYCLVYLPPHIHFFQVILFPSFLIQIFLFFVAFLRCLYFNPNRIPQQVFLFSLHCSQCWYCMTCLLSLGLAWSIDAGRSRFNGLPSMVDYSCNRFSVLLSPLRRDEGSYRRQRFCGPILSPVACALTAAAIIIGLGGI